jgi:hypothetical protein
MRLVGHDRSGRKLRLRHLSAPDQDLGATMDAAYAGLKAGAPLVFDDGAALAAVPLSAASEADDATVLRWAPGAVLEDADFLIADTRVLGRAKQVMKMAAAERADEVTLGQNRLPVANAAMFTVGAAALVESGGLLMPMLVIAKDVGAKTITLNRGVVSSLRRSATRVLEGHGLRGHHDDDPRRQHAALARAAGQEEGLPAHPAAGGLAAGRGRQRRRTGHGGQRGRPAHHAHPTAAPRDASDRGAVRERGTRALLQHRAGRPGHAPDLAASPAPR